MEAAFGDLQAKVNTLMLQNNELRTQITRLESGQVTSQQANVASTQAIANLTGLQASELQKLGKPGVYNNNDDDWLEWNEKLLAYVGLIDVNVKLRMKAIASNPQDESMTVIAVEDERGNKWAQVIKHMLLMVTVKRGNLAVRRAKDDNGFEAYRLLAKQHVTRNNKQSTDLLLEIMRFQFGPKIEDVDENLELWDLLIQEYEAMPSVLDGISDEMKKTVVLHGMPEPLNEHLSLNRAQYTTFEKVIEAVESYTESKRIGKFIMRYRDKKSHGNKKHDDDHMDVSALELAQKKKDYDKRRREAENKDKGKGKGKGKGKDEKGKGKGKGQKGGEKVYFDGECNKCGFKGHKASDCFTKKENYKKKSVNQLESDKKEIDMLENDDGNDAEDDEWFIGSLEPSCKIHSPSCICEGCIRIKSLAVEMEKVFVCHACGDESTNPIRRCETCGTGDCKSVELRPKEVQQAVESYEHELDKMIPGYGVFQNEINMLKMRIEEDVIAILNDSGSYTHACPKEFAPHIPITPPEDSAHQQATACNSATLIHYGSKLIPFSIETVEGERVPVQIRFEVFNIKRPLVSTTRMAKHGFTSTTGPGGSYLKKGSKVVKLAERNGLPFFDVRYRRHDEEKYLIMANENGTEDEDAMGVERDDHEAGVERDDREEKETTRDVELPGLTEEEKRVMGQVLLESSDVPPPPRGMTRPKGPTDAERRRHVLTHQPYRSWCDACVEGRGKESPHKSVTAEKKATRVSRVQLDYFFLKKMKDGHVRPLLTAVDTEKGGIHVNMAVKKGHCPYTEATLANSLNSFGLTGELVLQCDKESGLLDVANRVAARRKGITKVIETAKNSSKAAGDVERMHQTLEGMIRTATIALEKHYGVELGIESIVLPWLVRHQGWIANHFFVREDGQTFFQRMNNVPYTSTVLEFGEIVEAKLQSKDVMNAKLEARWTRGVWLGRATESDEHIVGTAQGVMRTRSVRPRILEEQWDKTVFLAMQGVPWDIKQEKSAGSVSVTVVAVPVTGIHEQEKILKPSQLFLRQFWEAKGKTESCPACTRGGQGVHHSRVCCKERQLAMRVENDDLENKKQNESSSSGLVREPVPLGDQQTESQQAVDDSPPADDDDSMQPLTPRAVGTKRSVDEGRLLASPVQQQMDVEDDTVGAATEESVAKKMKEVKDEMSINALSRNWCCEDANISAVLSEEDVTELEQQLIGGYPALLVIAGKQKEMENIEFFEVKTDILEKDVPAGAVVRPTDWVMAQKGDEVRCRLVYKDYADVKRDDLFSPTPTPTAVRIVLLYAAMHDLRVQVGDLSVAFMHAEPKEVRYAKPPPDLKQPGVIWKLLKAMNGMRTASQDFERFLSEVLTTKMHLRRTKAEPTLYFAEKDNLRLVCHVDDPMACGSAGQLDRLWKEMSQWVLIRVGGVFSETAPVKYLGREYLRVETDGRRGFKVKHPKKYLDSCTDVLGVTGCKALTCPGDNTVAVEAGRVGRELTPASRHEHSLFRSGVGKLQFILEERTDLAYPVKRLSQKLAAPMLADMDKLKKVLRYLEGTKEDWQYMTVNKDKSKFSRGDKVYIDQYVDTDWAGDTETRKSTTSSFSFVDAFLLHGGATTQSVIAQSTGEAEYYGMGTGSADAIFVQTLLTEIGLASDIRLLNDASAARGMANRAGLSKKLRHMHVKCLYVQELVRTKALTLAVVKGHYNPSDLGTKYFSAPRLEFLKRMVGLTAGGLEDTYGPRGQIRELPEFGARAPEINMLEMPDVSSLVATVQENLDDELDKMQRTSWALWFFLALSWFAGFVVRGWAEKVWLLARPRRFAYKAEGDEPAMRTASHDFERFQREDDHERFQREVQLRMDLKRAQDDLELLKAMNEMRTEDPPRPSTEQAAGETQTEDGREEELGEFQRVTSLFKTKFGERLHLYRGCRTLANSADENVFELRVCLVCMSRLRSVGTHV